MRHGESTEALLSNQHSPSPVIFSNPEDEEDRVEEVVASSDDHDAEDDSAVAFLPPTRVYKRRFYILLAFCVFSLMEASVCVSWGPVSDTARQLFHWDMTTLALLPNWVPIVFVLTFLPMMKLLLRFGLRCTTVHCTALLALATGLRCLPCKGLARTILSHVCAILTGYTSSLAMMAPTSLAATWFPFNERTTATALLTLSNNNFAGSFVFLMARVMVRDANISSYHDNETLIIEAMEDMNVDLTRYLLIFFCICSTVFLAVLIYFPRCPPTPPSFSATMARPSDFRQGAGRLLRKKSFLLLLLSFAIPSGSFAAFISVMVEMMRPYHIPQSSSNKIGVFMSVGGIPAALLFSRVADWRKLWMKHLLTVAALFAGLFFLWFALMGLEVLPMTPVYVYTAVIGGGVFANGALPLFYDFGCEICHPTSEEIITGLMTGAQNLSWALVLGLVMIKPLGTFWLSSVLSGSFLMAIPVLLGLREDYRRHRMDSVIISRQSVSGLNKSVSGSRRDDEDS